MFSLHMQLILSEDLHVPVQRQQIRMHN